MLLVCQLGAREHYAIPAMAHSHAELARLITDCWNPFGDSSLALAKASGVNPLIRFAARRNPAIPRSKVVSVSRLTLSWWVKRWWYGRGSQWRLASLERGREFAAACTHHLGVPHDVTFGFCGECLEVLKLERKRGIGTILDQYDAAKVEDRLVQEEEKHFPRLVLDARPMPEAYYRRLAQEWEEAGVILVNSAWTKSALVDQGVTADKIAIVPIAYRPHDDGFPRGAVRGKLKVLWLGALSLTKGLPYALEAAARLTREPVHFTFGGPIKVNRRGLQLPDNVTILGPVPRPNVQTLYRSHDVFLFPTLSDGFGITQLEAMASGLPVIATSHCGAVVEDHVSGLVIPTRNASAIANAILELLDSPLTLPAMSAAALKRSRDFTPERVWPKLKALMDAVK